MLPHILAAALQRLPSSMLPARRTKHCFCCAMLQGFPTIKLFTPGSATPTDYQGPREAKALANTAVGACPAASALWRVQLTLRGPAPC